MGTFQFVTSSSLRGKNDKKSGLLRYFVPRNDDVCRPSLRVPMFAAVYRQDAPKSEAKIQKRA